VTAGAGVATARVPGYLGRVLDGDVPVGTCFQVAPGVLATAWHVLNDIGAATDDARVRIDPLAGGEAFDAAVKRLDQAHDLGVLKAERHLSATAEELTATDQMAPQTAVTVTGHSVISDSGRIVRSLTTVGQWAGPATWEDAPPAGRMTAEALVPGMSGAPVIRNSDGAVAGVVSGRYNSADEWLKRTVWVVRTEDLAALLDGIAEVTIRQAAAQVLPGWPLDEVRDPFALEVHRPVQPEDPQPSLPELPAYVPREHDQALRQVVREAAGGSSGIAVLVGGSSTGKTRACWEALGLLRGQDPSWRLWHPIDPSRPDAALRELPVIGPRTVVWLNEAQFYLNVADAGLGEAVAAGLRELLRNPARAPVLVLATLWPPFWDALTAQPADNTPDPHTQARELLADHDITVPTAFTAAQLQQLGETGDVRLARAAAGAQDGQVIQYLAGAPELLARYRNAPPAEAALIHAAMDARRLGMGIALPRAFLEAAAPGYLTGAEWDAVAEDWENRLEQALAYTVRPTKGVRGLLTRIHPPPARSGATVAGSRASDQQRAVGQASTPGVPLYRLADYLDQHGRTHRKGEIPPDGFWAAAANHAFPADQAALGDAAHFRGLYRDAAQLHKNAAERGSLTAVFYLTRPPGYPRPAYLRNDVRPVHWAVAHAPLDDPYGVARLLDGLRRAGAGEQAAALLRRDPAAHVSLDDPGEVARLLDGLREAGAGKQAAALAVRAAAQVPLDDPGGVASLLDGLREAGAGEQAAALAVRTPEAGMFALFRRQMDRQDQFRFGREADGSPARPWDWGDLH
jgi:Trypsin-like peptidase domain